MKILRIGRLVCGLGRLPKQTNPLPDKQSVHSQCPITPQAATVREVGGLMQRLSLLKVAAANPSPIPHSAHPLPLQVLGAHHTPLVLDWEFYLRPLLRVDYHPVD